MYLVIAILFVTDTYIPMSISYAIAICNNIAIVSVIDIITSINIFIHFDTDIDVAIHFIKSLHVRVSYIDV